MFNSFIPSGHFRLFLRKESTTYEALSEKGSILKKGRASDSSSEGEQNPFWQSYLP